MKILKILTIAVAASALSAGFADARLKEEQPAEFPPLSYKGKQYVDSRGCVFIRAGIGNDVAWIPRVTRKRKMVCGLQPSLTAGTTLSSPSAAPRTGVVQITLDDPNATTAAQPGSASGQVISTSGASPYVSRPVVSAPRVQTRVVQQPVEAVPYDGVYSQTRAVPRHVAENRVNTRNVTVPHGYQRIWTDDRLNPHRTEQNLQGRSDMAYVWTQTVPRRLVNVHTGRDVTASVPLIYPYTNLAHQRHALGDVKIVKRDGKIYKKVARVQNATYLDRSRPSSSRTVYSSRSAPDAAKPAAPIRRAVPQVQAGTPSFIQVGTYRVKDNALRVARHLGQLGMTARVSKYTRNGEVFMSVKAGPFTEVTQTRTALATVRRAGYSDAFTRQ